MAPSWLVLKAPGRCACTLCVAFCSFARRRYFGGSMESTATKDWQLGLHALARATPSFQLTELLRATANTTMQTYHGSPLCAASRGCGKGLRRTSHPVPCRHFRQDGFAVVRRGSSRVVVRCNRVRSSNLYVKAFWAPHASCRRPSQAETRCASASESQRCSTLSGQSVADRRILCRKLRTHAADTVYRHFIAIGSGFPGAKSPLPWVCLGGVHMTLRFRPVGASRSAAALIGSLTENRTFNICFFNLGVLWRVAGRTFCEHPHFRHNDL